MFQAMRKDFYVLSNLLPEYLVRMFQHFHVLSNLLLKCRYCALKYSDVLLNLLPKYLTRVFQQKKLRNRSNDACNTNLQKDGTHEVQLGKTVQKMGGNNHGQP